MTPVPKSWPGCTMAILGGGPSLTAEQVAAVSAAGCRILAIKDSIRLAPFADVLYACDAKWWKHYGPTLAYDGPKYALEAGAAPWATVLRNAGYSGLELEPDGLRTGKNSGFQSIGLARHLGAKRILLLGYDMKPGPKGQHHWFGPHPYATADPPYRAFLDLFPTLVEPLKAAGVEVINCTPESALTCFPSASLADALAVAA